MRMSTLILTVMAAALLMASASSQQSGNPARKGQVEGSAKKVKELQKQRIATLKQLADTIASDFQSGIGSFEEVSEARLLVLKAELDAAEKDSHRITIYKATVDVLREYEQWTDRRFKIAPGTFSTVLKAKAKRLEAEINLERAKAKEAKESK
jgi:outer membrane protein TolC